MPATHSVSGRLMSGSLSARRHLLADLASATDRRDLVNPHTSEYVRFHLLERWEDSFLMAAVASFPCMPSTENTRGVKCRWRARQRLLYLAFFSRSWRCRTVLGSVVLYDAASVSVTRMSKMVVVPRFQNPWAETSPRSSGWGSVAAAPA